MRVLILLLGALLSAALAGCQTPHSFAKPDVSWNTRVGQLQYVGGGRSVIGECVVSRRGATDFQLEFSSGPGFPLMRLSRAGEITRAEGVLARGAWQGRPEQAPEQLRGWMRVAHSRAVAGSETRQIINSPETGERFVFVFSN